MPENIFPLDSSKKFTEQEKLGHNRWHPEIPPVATVKPGDSFRVDCREWFDGAIKNDDSAQDILDAPLLTVHTLSGPFAVEGAKPGDLLIVDILDVGPIPQEGPAGRPGLGLHRHLRHPQRRRLSHRTVPRRLQGDLGLQRSGRHLSSRAGRQLHRPDPPRPDGHRAVG